jgi:hypothetical protein
MVASITRITRRYISKDIKFITTAARTSNLVCHGISVIKVGRLYLGLPQLHQAWEGVYKVHSYGPTV